MPDATTWLLGLPPVPVRREARGDYSQPATQRGEQGGPVMGLKTTLIAAVAVGLVAGSTIGAVAQDDSMAPAAVTGTSTGFEKLTEGSREWVDGALRGEGLMYATTWEASDPRLSGAVALTANRDEYDQEEMAVIAASAAVENDDGRWAGSGTYLEGEELGETWTLVMQGQDAYEGLTALVVMGPGGRSFAAAIFPGEMPKLPEEPPAE